jgi:hypothetical protein
MPGTYVERHPSAMSSVSPTLYIEHICTSGNKPNTSRAGSLLRSCRTGCMVGRRTETTIISSDANGQRVAASMRHHYDVE